MNPNEDELAAILNRLSMEVGLAQMLFQEQHMNQLCNCLNRIERNAFTAACCILDIADL